MPILWPLVALQAILAVGVIVRMLRSAKGIRIGPDPTAAAVAAGSISVIVPVLNEFGRLGPCLERLIASGPDVGEIIVVDGGSIDGTLKIVASFAAVDPRVRALYVAPVPSDWNGKAWGLACGLEAASPDARWIATIDADVRIRPGLLRAMAASAERSGVAALSIGTKQELGDRASSIVHPAMLATLVYRYGLPGQATKSPGNVQANGQCFLGDRRLLLGLDAFAKARTSVCEDVTVARILARAGHRVGFYEADDLAVVRMHDTWREVWANWPRSLSLRDGISGWHTARGLAEVWLVGALPPAILLALLLFGTADAVDAFAFELNAVLVCVRIGVMAGTRRAYRNPAWTYWLSLFADLPVAGALVISTLRRRHQWRGRMLVVSERIT